MKNLPDKIYLNLGELSEEELNETDFQDLSEITWSEDDVQGKNVEYVRKDDFIENICEWLSKHAIKYYLGGSKFLGTDKLVEDFKIAMRL